MNYIVKKVKSLIKDKTDTVVLRVLDNVLSDKNITTVTYIGNYLSKNIVQLVEDIQNLIGLNALIPPPTCILIIGHANIDAQYEKQ